MSSSRLEAFSDAVIAIVMTIMVLELHPPEGADWSDLRPVLPVFFAYLLSFVNLGIYWNNHHHMMVTVHQVNGKILWANLHLLFWLSLFPFMTGWMGKSQFAPVPTAMYGIVSLLAALAYFLLQTVIIASQGQDSKLKAAIGDDLKGRASPLLYLAGIPLAFLSEWIAVGIYAFVALIWLVPDKRIESILD